MKKLLHAHSMPKAAIYEALEYAILLQMLFKPCLAKKQDANQLFFQFSPYLVCLEAFFLLDTLFNCDHNHHKLYTQYLQELLYLDNKQMMLENYMLQS